MNANVQGADMVELDVQLTKDLVPVIYHDYYVNIAMKKVESMQRIMMFMNNVMKDVLQETGR